MDSLSAEILSMILTQVKSGVSGNNDLLACFRVNQAWHQIASSIFYEHIVLDSERMVPFEHSFKLKYGQQVRTLTLLVSSKDAKLPIVMKNSDLVQRMRISSILLSSGMNGQPMPPRFISNQKPDPGMDAKIRSIIPILKTMKNLASFSLSIKASSDILLERSTIAGIVDALPASCTALELDTLGLDEQPEAAESHIHLCDSLRRVMPQMHHVRIRVASICPALLGTGELDLTEQSPVIDPVTNAGPPRVPFKPVEVPNLRTLVVHCTLPSRGAVMPGGKTKYCNRAGQTLVTVVEDIGPCWAPIITAMKQLVKGDKGPPSGARIFAINATDELDLTPPPREFIRYHSPAANPLQHGPAGQFERHGTFIRLVNGCVRVTTPEDVTLLAEEHAWYSTIGGGRVPRALLIANERGLPSYAGGLVPSPITPLKTGEQWRKEFFMLPFPGHLNAPRVQQRLLEMGARNGTGVYLAADTWLASDGHERLTPRPVRKILRWKYVVEAGRRTEV